MQKLVKRIMMLGMLFVINGCATNESSSLELLKDIQLTCECEDLDYVVSYMECRDSFWSFLKDCEADIDVGVKL